MVSVHGAGFDSIQFRLQFLRLATSDGGRFVDDGDIGVEMGLHARKTDEWAKDC